MADILDKIVASKRKEVEAAIRARPLRDLMTQADAAPPALDFVAPLRCSPPIRLIAEVKKASPSKGVIRADFVPANIAKEYETAGASCVSVLTDHDFFQGSIDDLAAVRQSVRLPLLRKDFIIHPYQIFEARAAGADAVLLIAECLNRQELRGLYQLTRDLGMAALVEIHSASNLDNALHTGTELIGVNNRDLRSFEVDLQNTLTLRKKIPEHIVLVGESGIASRDDAVLLEENRIQAMLVGESLLRQDDIPRAVATLIGRNAEDRPADI